MSTKTPPRSLPIPDSDISLCYSCWSVTNTINGKCRKCGENKGGDKRELVYKMFKWPKRYCCRHGYEMIHVAQDICYDAKTGRATTITQHMRCPAKILWLKHCHRGWKIEINAQENNKIVLDTNYDYESFLDS